MMNVLHSPVLHLASLSVAYGFQRQNTLLQSSLTILKMSGPGDFVSPNVSRFQTGERPEGTEDFIMQQTMLRVKDPVKSLEFYCDALGFRLVLYLEFPQWGFNVYFVCPGVASDIPEGQAAQWEYCMNNPGTIELTWNYGSESEGGPVYNTGNADSTGTQDGQKIKVLCVAFAIWSIVWSFPPGHSTSRLFYTGRLWSYRNYSPRRVRSL